MKRLFFIFFVMMSFISVKAQQYVHYADGDGKYVNIRKQPTANSAIIGRMTADYDARLISTSGNWYCVNWRGITGWVNANHCVLRNGSTSNNNRSYNNTGRGLSRNNFYSAASSRRLSASELRGFNKRDLRILRNEIYARHGYIFNSSDLANYFSAFNWYVPRYKNVDNMLNTNERYNVNLIKSLE